MKLSRFRCSSTLGGTLKVWGTGPAAPMALKITKSLFGAIPWGKAIRSWLQAEEWKCSRLQVAEGGLSLLWEFHGEGTQWLYLTLRSVGVEVWHTLSDGSALSPRTSGQNSLKTKIPAGPTNFKSGVVLVAAQSPSRNESRESTTFKYFEKQGQINKVPSRAKLA